MTTLKFAKVNPDATIPTKRKEDAGYDIYACIPGVDSVVLNPGQIYVFPTGIASAFEPGYVAELRDKSSLAAKGITVLGGIIDSGYRGEWKALLINLSKNSVELPTDKAICQVIFKKLMDDTVEEIDYKELRSISSERGGGGFGSTGK